MRNDYLSFLNYHFYKQLKNFSSMKKSFFMAIAFATVMVSCTSTTDDLAGLESLTTDASGSITSYVANNFPDATIVSSKVSKGTVTTELNTGEQVKFSTSGTVISYSNNTSNGLVADSLGLTAHNDSINDGHRGGDGKHGDKGGKHGGKDGKHGGKDGGRHGNDSTQMSGRHGHDRHFQNEIAIDSLAAEINTYITTNYSGYTVIHAEKDTICVGVVTEVMVALGTTQPVKLVFDASNVYLLKAERYEYASVPTAVSDAVTANYRAYTVMKKCEKLTLDDGSINYLVHLKNADTRKAVTFKADGTVSCEK